MQKQQEKQRKDEDRSFLQALPSSAATENVKHDLVLIRDM